MDFILRKTARPNREEIHFLLTNLEFNGCDYTTYPGGGFSLDKFTVSLDGYDFIIKKESKYEEIMKTLKKRTLQSWVTGRLIVKAPIKDRNRVFPIVESICNLLSFATGNTVLPSREIYFKSGRFSGSQSRSIKVDPFLSSNYLIRDLPPCELRDFVQKSYPNYKKYKDDFGLPILYNYHLLIKSNSFLDIRCLLGFVLLECLADHAKTYFEKNGKPIESSLKRANKAKLANFVEKGKMDQQTADSIVKLLYQYPTLKDGIDRVIQEFGLNYKKGEADLFSKRNVFIHGGVWRGEIEEHVKLYKQLLHFIDRLLLGILQYDGTFLDCSNGYKEEKLALRKESH